MRNAGEAMIMLANEKKFTTGKGSTLNWSLKALMISFILGKPQRTGCLELTVL